MDREHLLLAAAILQLVGAVVLLARAILSR
jgi:hypothetical protein